MCCIYQFTITLTHETVGGMRYKNVLNVFLNLVKKVNNGNGQQQKLLYKCT